MLGGDLQVEVDAHSNGDLEAFLPSELTEEAAGDLMLEGWRQLTAFGF